jgi:AraC-like DNA-binding protein
MDTNVASSPWVDALGAPSAVHEEPEDRCFMARNMQIEHDLDVRDLGPVKVARSHGIGSSFARARHHVTDGRDLVYELDDATGAWSICIDRASLEPLLTGMQAPLRRCLQGDVPELRLLRAYLSGLFALDQDHDPTLAATHIRELVLSAVGVRGDVRALLRESGAHAVRQSAVLQMIRQRAGERGLNPAEVAREAGISVRYLHQLLEPTGRTFSQHLLEQRLQRALEALRNPEECGKIADIAFACGFSDISHFNRSFRRAFGDTPHGVRVRSARARSPSASCR